MECGTARRRPFFGLHPTPDLRAREGGTRMASFFIDRIGQDDRSGQTQRRRWESNPLEPGCSRSPGRLAPASRTKCPRQELNLVHDLRRVVCESVTLRGPAVHRIPRPGIEPGLAASKTAVRPSHSRGAVGTVPSPGVEPGPRPSEGRMRFRHTPRATNRCQQGCKDSNPVREFWRLAALPGAHPYERMKAEG
jgi:hypothetical protein